MKKLLTVIAAAIFAIYPSICFASYVIHLKDGTKFATDQYYEEGDQIKFKRYGGVIGIQKDRVSEIEQIEDLPEVKAIPNQTETPTAKQETGKQKASQDEAKGEGTQQEGAAEAEKNEEKAQEEEKDKAQQDEAAKIAAFLEEKKRIDNEMKRAYSEYKDATSKSDKEARKKHLGELGSLRDKLTELEEKVKAAYGGKMPEWWNDES